MVDIDPITGLPKDLLDFEEIAKENQKVIISTVRRMYGKMVTIVDGIDDKSIDIEKLAKTLKAKCAAGGTIKGRAIELQGEHKKKAAKVLEDNGYFVEVI